MSRYARLKPISGDRIIGMATLLRMTSQCTVVAEATPAPVRPPMSACVDDEGSPNHHVMRFQAMAPMSPASTMVSPWVPASPPISMMPDPIVVATSVPSSAPMRLNTAAMISATRGVSARVDTDVAMALAASWKPLV
jgi:hypothetical protein